MIHHRIWKGDNGGIMLCNLPMWKSKSKLWWMMAWMCSSIFAMAHPMNPCQPFIWSRRWKNLAQLLPAQILPSSIRHVRRWKGPRRAWAYLRLHPPLSNPWRMWNAQRARCVFRCWSSLRMVMPALASAKNPAWWTSKIWRRKLQSRWRMTAVRWSKNSSKAANSPAWPQKIQMIPHMSFRSSLWNSFSLMANRSNTTTWNGLTTIGWAWRSWPTRITKNVYGNIPSRYFRRSKATGMRAVIFD